MEPDPIVEEVHRIRAEMLAKFNGDLRALLDDARRRQIESGVPTVSFVPRPDDEAETSPVSETPKKAR